MRCPLNRYLLTLFLAISTLGNEVTNEVEYDDNIDVEELKKLAKEKCMKNPDYQMPIWKCLEKTVFDVSCMVQIRFFM